MNSHPNDDQMLEQVQQAIINFEDETIAGLVQRALESGMDPQAIILEGLVPGLEEVGRLYAENEYFIPELVMCGNAMKAAMGVLDPIFEAGGSAQRLGRILVGTVEGDLHDIGKNLVLSMLRGSGFETHDLGVNVPTATFVKRVAEQRPDVLALSALLLTTRTIMRDVILALDEAGIREGVKVIVGGSPVTQKFADEIGADGYGADAVDAVRLSRRFVGR